MKTLERKDVEAMVRDLEQVAYGLTLRYEDDRAKAAEALLEAFGQVAPFFPRLQSDRLKRKLDATVRQRFSGGDWSSGELEAVRPTSVPPTLHAQLVDVVEEGQQDEPVKGRKITFGAIAAAVLVVGLGGFGFVRWSALNAAGPIVAQTNPGTDQSEVPTQGNLWVRFSRAPAFKPSITVQPADGSLAAADWDGHTVLVGYSGLRLETSYTLTVATDYRSKYGDVGHFVEQWRFTTEPYPILVNIDPPKGATGAFRNGQISVGFNHRPPVTPTVSFTPDDAVLQTGQWSGSTWTVNYIGLKPLTTYQATVLVDYGVSKANIRQTWSFTTEPGLPPAGIPVIWYYTSDQNGPPGQSGPQRLVAIDWTGKLVGTMYQSPPSEQSPDGSFLYTLDGTIVDRMGLALTSQKAGYYPVFADDSHDLCQLVNNTEISPIFGLVAGPVRGPLKQIAFVDQSAQRSGLTLLACSFLNNRAVVAESGPAGTTAVLIFQLSTGRLVFQRSYAVPATAAVSSSRDGRYLAEQITTSDAQGNTLSWMTLIRRTSDGRVMAKLPDQRIITFSSDDSRVITAPAAGDSTRNEIDMIVWNTGKIVWRLPAGPFEFVNQPINAMAQPNGAAMAVAITTQPSSAYGQLWLVHEDGSAQLVLNESFYAGFFAGP